MPSFRASRLERLPSSSNTCAAESSKRTPLTMIEPKPEMWPEANELGAAPVPPLDGPALPPPPQPASSSAAAASWKDEMARPGGPGGIEARRMAGSP